jgi:hypothetical protein
MLGIIDDHLHPGGNVVRRCIEHRLRGVKNINLRNRVAGVELDASLEDELAIVKPIDRGEPRRHIPGNQQQIIAAAPNRRDRRPPDDREGDLIGRTGQCAAIGAARHRVVLRIGMPADQFQVPGTVAQRRQNLAIVECLNRNATSLRLSPLRSAG